MQITVQQEDLAAALQMVQRSTASRTTLPVLTGILFEARAGALTLSATDLETALRTTIPATVREEGAVVLPARYVVELVRRAPFGEIEVATEGERAQATLRFGRSQYRIHGFPHEQFPLIAADFDGAALEVPQDRFRDAVQRTGFAVSTSDMRPILTGVQLRLAPTGFHAVATDGIRVAHYRGEGVAVEDDGVEVVVPGRTLQELARLLGEGEEILRLGMRDNRLLAEANGILFQTTVLSGQYPAVLDMMPKSYIAEMDVDRRAFVDACERAALIAGAPDQPNAVRMVVAPGGVTLAAQAVDIGAAEDFVEADVRGEGLEIAFNARYLLDGLRHVGGESVRCAFSGPIGAARFSGEGDEFEYFLLPMRIS
ncbi:MAG: DNA polymerase III subunit beta [Firmicutes bacterium]|nr:DNA polymerase III subunit beta [Bacillota bacterium]